MLKTGASALQHKLIPLLLFGGLIILCVLYILRLPNTVILRGSISSESYPNGISFDSVWEGVWQRQFEKYFSDNFYGKPTTVKCHNQVVYSIFNDCSGDWIQGKDGYLFPKYISQDVAYAGFLENNNYYELTAYANKVAQLQHVLRKQEKDFLYVLSPVKTEIYPDYLPWYLRLSYNRYSNLDNSRHRLLIRAFEEAGVNYYDATEDLMNIRGNPVFDAFSKTGMHWTLTATAIEMQKMFESIGERLQYTNLPRIQITEITNDFYDIDKDILYAQNVYIPKVSDHYTSPIISYDESEDSLFLFGTSMCGEITDSLYRDSLNKGFNSLVFQEYFTEVTTCDSSGKIVAQYNKNNTEEDLGVIDHIIASDLVIMEQPAAYGVMETHVKFLDYALECLNDNEYSFYGNLINSSQDNTLIELHSFHGLEDWGRWSEGNECAIIIHDDNIKNITLDGNVTIVIKTRAFAVEQDVAVMINGKEIDVIHVTTNTQEFRVPVAADLITDKDNILSFKLSKETTSPYLLGQSDDSRILGLGFEKLLIVGEAD